MNLLFLGTNGWYDTDTGNTISLLLKTKDHQIVLDAGSGFSKLNRYIDENRPVFLFLSHFHLDHTIGLHTLVKNRFPKGITIIVHEGGTEILTRFINLPFSKPLKDMPFKTNILEVPQKITDLPFRATVLPMVHSSLTLGIRLEIDQKVIAYCPDTGYCENAVQLAGNADLLITECAFPPNRSNPSWPHLNPETAARIAREAGAKKLALVHFDASLYPDLKSRANAEKAARKIFRNTIASQDGMEIKV